MRSDCLASWRFGVVVTRERGQPPLPASLGGLLALLAVMAVAITGCSDAGRAGQTGFSSVIARGCLQAFTAPDVPALGANEVPSDPPKATSSAGIQAAALPGGGLSRHPMLYIGEGYNTMLLIDRGAVIWSYATGKGWEFDDIWLLSNGNILFSRMSYAEEITPQKTVVWHMDAPAGSEIHSLQPNGLDRVLVMQNGLPPRLMIIKIRTGERIVDHAFPAPAPADRGSVHGQTRRARITASGTYLVSWLSQGKVVEYGRDFTEIWSYAIPSPWAAIRLPDGLTLITDERDKLIREVDRHGATRWEFRLNEVPPGIPFLDSQSCVRLANGNTVLCSRGGGGKGCQLIEITPAKQLVWAVHDWKTLGPATAVQLLDEPGMPEQPGDLLR